MLRDKEIKILFFFNNRAIKITLDYHWGKNNSTNYYNEKYSLKIKILILTCNK